MTSFLLAGITIVAVISAAIFIKALLQAEDGYEDETGFHHVASSPASNRTDARSRLETVLISSSGEGI